MNNKTPPPLVMVKGQTYQVKVVHVEDSQKEIAGGKKRIYRIHCHDKKGNAVIAEYLAPTADLTNIQRDMAVASEFPIDAYRWVVCWQVSPKGTPSIDPAEDPTLAGIWNSIKKDTGNGEPGNTAGPDIPYRPNCYTVQITGSSIAFAMAFAKDLLVAETRANNIEPEWAGELTDADVDRMIGWADKINRAICDKINFDK